MSYSIYKFDIQFSCLCSDAIVCDLPIAEEDDRTTGAQVKSAVTEVIADGLLANNAPTALSESIVETLSIEDWDKIARAWDEKCDEFSSDWDDEQPLLYLHYTELFEEF
jgi:hypothetical protein